jgi:hypothetical protein
MALLPHGPPIGSNLTFDIVFNILLGMMQVVDAWDG